jgi:hypothetical protein
MEMQALFRYLIELKPVRFGPTAQVSNSSGLDSETIRQSSRTPGLFDNEWVKFTSGGYLDNWPSHRKRTARNSPCRWISDKRFDIQGQIPATTE